jgi:hypothetical protein
MLHQCCMVQENLAILGYTVRRNLALFWFVGIWGFLSFKHRRETNPFVKQYGLAIADYIDKDKTCWSISFCNSHAYRRISFENAVGINLAGAFPVSIANHFKDSELHKNLYGPQKIRLTAVITVEDFMKVRFRLEKKAIDNSRSFILRWSALQPVGVIERDLHFGRRIIQRISAGINSREIYCKSIWLKQLYRTGDLGSGCQTAMYFA